MYMHVYAYIHTFYYLCVGKLKRKYNYTLSWALSNILSLINASSSSNEDIEDSCQMSTMSGNSQLLQGIYSNLALKTLVRYSVSTTVGMHVDM